MSQPVELKWPALGSVKNSVPKKLKCGEIAGDTKGQHLGPAYSTHESVPEHKCISHIYTH